MRLALVLSLLATAAQAAPARLADADVRAFVARQSKAWNAGDLGGYFALFTPDATFTDQALARDGRVVPYGTSTLAHVQAVVCWRSGTSNRPRWMPWERFRNLLPAPSF